MAGKEHKKIKKEERYKRRNMDKKRGRLEKEKNVFLSQRKRII